MSKIVSADDCTCRVLVFAVPTYLPFTLLALWRNSTILLTSEYTISSIPPTITMASAAAPVPLPRPRRTQNSHPGLTPANTTPPEAGLVENQGIKGILKALPTITVVISTLLNGVAAAAILSEENGTLATDINSSHNRDVKTFIDFTENVIHLSGLSSFLAISDHKRMWLIGSGILCPLTFSCALARTSNHFFILRIVMEFLLGLMLTISERLMESSIPFHGRVKKNVLHWSPVILIVGAFYTWKSGIGFSDVYSWQLSFSIIATIDGVLFLMSIIVLPSDLKYQESPVHVLMFRHGLTFYWFVVTVFATYLGRLSHKLASVLSEFPF